MRFSARVEATRLGTGSRRLYVEMLEERRLLDAGLGAAVAVVPDQASLTPWQNHARPLDVNNDGTVTPLDALLLINRLSSLGSGPLPTPDPQNPPQVYYDTNGDNFCSPLDVLRIFNRLVDPPQVTLSTLTPISIDLTPQVTVTATGPAALPDGTQISVDVDTNGDGSFDSPGELNHTVYSLHNGTATFDITPALPSGAPTGTYALKMRARVTDADGVEGTSAVQVLTIDTRTSSALKNYVDTPDSSYSWSLATTVTGPSSAYTVYNVDMTSQTWRSTADVNLPEWRQWVQIIVPAGPVASTALLLIDGGNNTFTTPPTPPTASSALIGEALLAHSVVVDLKTVPSEPLMFTGDNPPRSRSEDAIIAYSFDQFLRHIGDPGNDTWPVLVAMVKSAVRAMDTVQAFVPNVTNSSINDFVVTGYSKRGWTTWLTAAVDNRVKAIIPGVFDNLNQGPQMVHHYGVYGFFAPSIQDYNDLHIFDRILTPEGMDLSQIVDPYRYLNNGRFTIPKLMIDSAGDQFFVPDSAQFYIHDLPGTRNYIRYLPNTSHSLDSRASDSTATFYDAILNNRSLPQYSWAVQPDGSIRVQAQTAPTQVLLWQMTNPTARDFRKDFNPPTRVWTSSVLTDQGGGVYVGSTPMPASGETAFFVELTFPSAIPSDPFVFTTEIHVNTNLPLYAWPFPTTNIAVASATNSADPILNQVASSLTVPTGSLAANTNQMPTSPTANTGPSVGSIAKVAILPMTDPDTPTVETDDNESDPDADLVDFVFGIETDEALA
jgi:PhoPQ-activated pathogenicity-related protein